MAHKHFNQLQRDYLIHRPYHPEIEGFLQIKWLVSKFKVHLWAVSAYSADC
jgi:hypothetical protein